MLMVANYSLKKCFNKIFFFDFSHCFMCIPQKSKLLIYCKVRATFSNCLSLFTVALLLLLLPLVLLSRHLIKISKGAEATFLVSISLYCVLCAKVKYRKSSIQPFCFLQVTFQNSFSNSNFTFPVENTSIG